MLNLRFLAILCLLHFLGLNYCLDICGDWTQYMDIKCVKVLEKRSTEEDSVKSCAQLDSSSTLVSIHSEEEQDFLNNLLAQYSNTTIYAWIGLKYINNSFQWLDQTVSNYTNWSDDAVKDGSDPCVQMSLFKPNQGKWEDESCKKTAITICQKKQEMNMDVLRHAVESMEKKCQKIIETHSSSVIPLGFLYTQLPKQSSPQQLWPNMKWSEVTQQYSGLFFRAEGSDSETFGQIQHADQSKITMKIQPHPVTPTQPSIPTQSTAPTKPTTPTQPTTPKPTTVPTPPIRLTNHLEWVNNLNIGWYESSLSLEITESEVRPKNTAVKIWKRIQ